jgi:hypothetical protein
MSFIGAAGRMGWWGTKTATMTGAAGLGATASAAARYGPSMYRGANAFSQTMFGASIGQMGAVGGMGIGAYSLLADRPVEGMMGAARGTAGFVSQMGEAMVTRPTYGSSVFQQSVQGLTFGLSSRRTKGW